MADQKIVSEEALTAIASDIKTALGSKANSSNVYTKTEVNELIQGTSVSDDIKRALLACFSHAVWADENGQEYINNLEDALYPTEGLVSISCVYTQSGTVYPTTSLDELKSDLVVTALYDDTHTEVVTNYTLSGTLTEGTSTITVTYQRKATTFNVVVSQEPRIVLYDWDFTQSLIDRVGGVTATLSAGTGHTAPERTANGIEFTEATQRVFLLNNFNFAGKTIEYDVPEADFKGNLSYHIRWLIFSDEEASMSYNMSPFIWRATSGNQGCSCYGFSSSTGSKRAWGSIWNGLSGNSSSVINCSSGKTIKIVCGTDKHTTSLYIDNVLIGTQTSCYYDSRCPYLMFGSSYGKDQTAGDQCYNMTLSGLRIYENQ